MTDSTPPRTLRDEIADIVRTAIVATYPETFGECADLAAKALLERFDIRPHNEPAGAPDYTTLTKAFAAVIRDYFPEPGSLFIDENEHRDDEDLLADVLTVALEAIAARDVGGDSPAEMEKP